MLLLTQGGLACLQEKAQQNFEVSMGISAHEVSLEQLADEIAQVYERCGFDRDATVSTLQMLTNIEVSTHHAICCALYNVLEDCCQYAHRLYACQHSLWTRVEGQAGGCGGPSTAFGQHHSLAIRQLTLGLVGRQDTFSVEVCGTEMSDLRPCLPADTTGGVLDFGRHTTRRSSG